VEGNGHGVEGLPYEPACSAVVHWTDTQCKVNVKLSLCLIKHYAMKAYGGVDIWIHIFLTLAIVGSEWSASRPCCFHPQERPIG
jgi:hypothetical protein